MLIALPDEVLDIIAEAFVDNILNRNEDKDTWNICVAKLIAKVKRPKDITQFRPIAIIPVLAKVYSKVIWLLATPSMAPLKGNQCAFTPNHRPEEVIYCLRSLIEKAIEWQIHLWIGDGDIAKAYDNTGHTVAYDD